MATGAAMRPAPAGDLASPVVTAVASHGIAGHRAEMECPTDEATWNHIVAAIDGQLLWTAFRRAVTDGAVTVTAEQRDVVESAASRSVMRDLRAEALLAATADTFGDAGIPYRVLKGASIAHRFYERPFLRSFCDVDLLVPGDTFADAVEVLLDAGGRRRYAEARPGFDRFSKGASFEMNGTVCVDLHRTFVFGPYGFLVDLEGIFDRYEDFELAGRRLPCLTAQDTFFNVCFHAALGDWPPRLTPLRDVARLLTAGGLDQEELMAQAREQRVQGVVARAVSQMDATLDGQVEGPIVDWANTRRYPAWERWLLSLYEEERSYRRQALAAVVFVPGVRAKFEYAADLAFPSPEYLAEREGNHRGRLLTALRLLRTGGSRSR